MSCAACSARFRIRCAACRERCSLDRSVAGTSLATALPLRVMTTSSPRSARSTSSESLFFASKSPTSSMGHQLDDQLAYPISHSPANMAGARRSSRRAPSTYQPACKPGSVGRQENLPRDGHSSGTPVTRRLQQPTRTANRGHTIRASSLARRCPRRPYSVLLPVGFAVPPPLPDARCALTAPFHPCVSLAGGRGLFSVALSLEFAALARGFFRRTLSGTVCPWSPDFPLGAAFRHWTQAAVRPTDRLEVCAFARRSKRARAISLTAGAACRRSRGPPIHRRAQDGSGAGMRSRPCACRRRKRG